MIVGVCELLLTYKNKLLVVHGDARVQGDIHRYTAQLNIAFCAWSRCITSAAGGRGSA